jgi:peptidoglycan/LPS O-acetylase OafA/YrhL
MTALADEVVVRRSPPSSAKERSERMRDALSSKQVVSPPGNSAAVAACEAPFHLGYRRWLDGLRGVAILLVLMFHLQLAPGGYLGVDIFFVISGFLITTLLVEEWERRGAISLKRFYARRALRLLPALFTMILAVYALMLVLRTPEESRAYSREMLVSASYIANWVTLHQVPMPTLGHTWSLSLEEQFYIFWPIILCAMLALNLSRRRILSIVCSGIVISMLLRFILFRLHRMHRTGGPEDTLALFRVYMGLDTRADSLLIGCLVSLLLVWNLLPRSPRFHNSTFWFSIAGLAPLAFFVTTRDMAYQPYYYGGFTLVAAIVGVMLIHLMTTPNPMARRILGFGPLVWVGRISYSLYLVHIPVMHFCKTDGLGWRFPLQTLTIAGLCVVAAAVSHYGIERPFLRLKGRFEAPKSDPVPTTTAVPPKAAA